MTTAPHRSPIAIVGIGCMFPGAVDLEAYWATDEDDWYNERVKLVER